MDSQTGHLSDDQIEQYGATADEESGNRTDFAETHLAECAACRARVLASARARLAGFADVPVKIPSRLDSAPNCPEEEALRELAAGLCSPEEASKLSEHAAQCAHCGPLLRVYAEDFSDDLTKDDQAVVEAMQTSSAKWRRDLTQRILIERDRLPASAGDKFRWRWVLGPAAIAACFAVAFGIWYSQRETPEKVEKLLAQAYTERRTIEMRLSGAAYAPLQQRRSAYESRLEVAGSLLQAESIIYRESRKRPEDILWLRARADADILEWHFESALKTLEHASELRSGDPDILRALAVCYFQRGQAQDHPADFGKAIDLLGQALEIQPNDAMALFNRAIAEEKLYMYGEAARDWERYLQLDPSGDWAKEAQERLHAVQDRVREHSRLQDEPLLDPGEFVEVFENGNRAAIERIGSRVEAYLDLASRKWLPADCQPMHAKRANRSVQRLAVKTLGDFLASRFGDRWLADIGRSARSTVFCEGVAALRDAITLNATGDFAEANSKARTATSLFRKANAEAGVLRAKVETVYALQHAAEDQKCLESASVSEQRARALSYRWVQIQLSLEKSNCYSLMSQYASAESAVRYGLRLAESSRFSTLSLRAQGLMAEEEITMGNAAKSWNLHLAALKTYWDGGAPPIRASQLYGGLSLLAEDRQMFYLERGLWSESRAAIKLAGNRAYEALICYRLAEALAAAGNEDSASREYQEAREILATLPRNIITNYYGVLAGVGWAKLEAKRHPQLARTRLEASRPFLTAYDALTCLDFYRTIGRIELLGGDTKAAEEDLWAGARFAEVARANISADRDRIVWMRESDDLFRSLVSLEYDKGNALRALEIWEWYRASSLRKSSTPLNGRVHAGMIEEVTAVGQTISATPTNEHLLIYAALDHKLVIWLVSAGSIKTTTVNIDVDSLSRLATSFLDLCADPNSPLNALQTRGRHLYDVLIGPMANQLDGPRSQILMELDSSISSLPIAALVQPDGSYFGDLHSIAISAGIMYRERLRKPQPFSKWEHALVVGAPALSYGGSEIQPLPAAQEEAELVAREFPRSTVLTGQNATWNTVQKLLPSADLFHFAGHSAIEAENVGLLLAKAESSHAGPESSALNARVLSRSLFRKCNLAVLSACSTERSENNWIHTDGLVFALLSSGVPDVIATRWNIDSTASTYFMEAFYKAMRAGNSPAESLRIASGVLRDTTRMQHPFYWAAFVNFSRS